MVKQIIVNGIVSGGIYALVAIGFSTIYRTVKFFHFAHGVVYTAGAYIAYSFAIQLGVHPILGFFLPRPLQA
jgi:branched-chain amino acid transport system permease protein